MLLQFQKATGGYVAINPTMVMLVEESKEHTIITMSDGGQTRVEGSYLNTVGLINGALLNR